MAPNVPLPRALRRIRSWPAAAVAVTALAALAAAVAADLLPLAQALSLATALLGG